MHNRIESTWPIGGNAYHWAAANPGFEAAVPLKHWYQVNAQTAVSASGGAIGKYVQYRPTSAGQKFYQQINVAKKGGDQTHVVLAVRGKAKRLAASDQGSVRLTLLTREVTYKPRSEWDPPIPGDCTWLFDGKNQNARDLVGPYFVRFFNEKTPSTSDWTQIGYEPPADTGTATWDAVPDGKSLDAMLMVTSSVVDSEGAPTFVGLDNLGVVADHFTNS
jgi:hypothetical protein